MPSLQDRLTHAKNLAEWKVNQQKRILEIQIKISDFEKQISRNMQVLSDTAYSLHKANKIQEKEISIVCKHIDTIYLAISRSKGELESARNEAPPDFIESTPTIYSNLVCPECGMRLTGKFCPVHGIEGIQESVPTPTASTTENGLICPECGRPVAEKFCVNCGVEGVEPSPTIKPQENQADADAKTTKAVESTKASSQPKSGEEVILVCPECGKELSKGMKFCNEHGKEGVPAPQKSASKPPSEEKKTTSKAGEGSETVLVCPECGKELEKGKQFCNEHGKKGVPKVKAATEKAAPSKPAVKKSTSKSTTAKKPAKTKKEG